MPEKRYRVIRESGLAKPLQSKTTNVKLVPVELMRSSKGTLPRSDNKSKLKSPPKKRIKPTKNHESKKSRRNSATIFNSDNVELKLVSQNPFNDAKKRADADQKSPQPGRLTRIDEEEDSLKIEDFDQPPQSTSTPIMGSTSRNSLLDFASPLPRTDMAYQVSPVLYSYNPMIPQYPYAYPYPYPYPYPLLTNNSPLQSKAYHERLRVSNTNPMQPLPKQSHTRTQIQPGVQPNFQMSYPLMEENIGCNLPLINSGFSPNNLTFRTVGETDYLGRDLKLRPPLFKTFGNNLNGSSGSSSYKSSGGDATYEGSGKS